MCVREPVLMKSPIPTDSWQVLQALHPNVLVVDPDPDARTRTVEAILEHSLPPVWRCERASLCLPSEAVGTLVVPDANRLTADEQRELLVWAESHRGTQIVSVSPAPLYPAVEEGTFLDRLYYRLNVVLLGPRDA